MKNLLSKSLVFSFHLLLKIAKFLILPIFPRSCNYLPSCSQYAVESYQKYGVITGSIITFKRLIRCHPFSKWQYDPVSDKYKKSFF